MNTTEILNEYSKKLRDIREGKTKVTIDYRKDKNVVRIRFNITESSK